MESSMSFSAILANVLKPAPGNHSGTYLTVEVNIVRSFEKNPLTGTHTHGENIHEKGSRQQGEINSSHRMLGRREIPIALRFYFHPVRNRQDQRSGKASQLEGT